MTFGAVLDACVLVPVALADTLLRAAEAELYRPLWSERILGEVRSAILEVHPDQPPARVDARLAAMAALGLHAVGPDDVLLDLADLDPPTMVEVVWSQAGATARPPLTPSQVLDSLERAGVPEFATFMRPLVG